MVSDVKVAGRHLRLAERQRAQQSGLRDRRDRRIRDLPLRFSAHVSRLAVGERRVGRQLALLTHGRQSGGSNDFNLGRRSEQRRHGRRRRSIVAAARHEYGCDRKCQE
jgi:hypothetical protein